MCNIYKEDLNAGRNESIHCKCDEYKKDIEDLKMEIETQKKKCEDVDQLRDELKKVKNKCIIINFYFLYTMSVS